MKWFFINPVREGWGGMEGWMVRLATGLRARGDECFIVARRASRWPDVCREHGLVFLPFMFATEIQPWAVAQLARWFDRYGPDVVCAKGFKQARFARMVSRRAAIAVKLPNAQGLSDEAPDQWTFRHVLDRVLVDNHAVRRHFLRFPWALDGRIVTVHNGLDAGPLPTPADRARARAALGVGDDRLVVAAVGRFSAEKRQQDAIRGFAASGLAGRGAGLWLIGDGPDRAALEACAAREGLGGAIRFMGWRDDVRSLLPGCDLLLNPSALEGLPNIVLEAMAAGVPVVASRAGGTPEAVESGVTGLLHDPGDVAALAGHLRALADDPERCARFGRAGAVRVRAEFSIPAMVEGVRAVMAGAVAARRALRAAPVALPGGGRWVARDDLPVDPAWLELADEPAAETVKESPQARVVRAAPGGRTLYVKRLNSDGWAGLLRYGWRPPRARTNFKLAHRLELLGVPVVPHLAAGWRRRHGRVVASTLVTGTPDGATNLTDWAEAHRADAPARRLLRRTAAVWLAKLHAAGVRPHDLKWSNLLVCPRTEGGPPHLVLLDLDNLRIGGAAGRRTVIRNLGQFYRSFEKLASARDMLEFAAVYRRTRRRSDRWLRSLLRAVADRMRVVWPPPPCSG